MNKREYIKSQQECAYMLGLTYDDYQKDLTHIKRSKFNASKKREKKELLNKLGLSEKDLKKKER